MTLTTPVRNPDLRDPDFMRRRAWLLLLLTIFVPGSSQLVAGNPRFGRALFTAWASLFGIGLVSLILYFVTPGFLLGFAFSWFGLLLIQILLVIAGVLWFVAAADTFRLVRFAYLQGKSKWVLVALSLTALFLPSTAAAYGSYYAGVTRGTFGDIFADTGAVAPINGKYTFMLLGGDSGTDRFGLRPDSISFVSIDANTGQITVVGIPRNVYNAPFADWSPMHDAWPDGFNCGDECLLAYVYDWAEKHKSLFPEAKASSTTNPGIEAMRAAVEGVTGIPVQFYVLVDMEGFKKLIDALGGIDIEVDQTVNVCVVGQPITDSFEPGVNHLNGYRALMYARTRCDTNDFDRMARQRQIEEAVLRQVQPSVVLSRFEKLANAGRLLVRTDLPQSMVGTMLDLAAKARKLEMVRADLVPPEFDYLYPNFDVAHKLVNTAVYPVSATPTPNN